MSQSMSRQYLNKNNKMALNNKYYQNCEQGLMDINSSVTNNAMRSRQGSTSGAGSMTITPAAATTTNMGTPTTTQLGTAINGTELNFTGNTQAYSNEHNNNTGNSNIDITTYLRAFSQQSNANLFLVTDNTGHSKLITSQGSVLNY